MKRMLLIVDPQIDFISGTLPVPGAGEAMTALAGYIREEAAGLYEVIVITADCHPYDHCSFAPCGGQWPRHCVADTVGGAIFPPLHEAAFEAPGITMVLHKGTDRNVEEYSIFRNDAARSIITDIVRDYGIAGIDFCGLAGDICVRSSLLDAIGLFPGVEFRVLTRFSPSLDGGGALLQTISDHGLTEA